jgi:hypothetical protein
MQILPLHPSWPCPVGWTTVSLLVTALLVLTVVQAAVVVVVVAVVRVVEVTVMF